MNVAITGANRGIGLELTRQYLAKGATVYAGARRPDEAAELKALGEGAKGKLVVAECDVSRDESVAKFAAAVGDAAIDLLINNAGVMGKSGTVAKLDLDDALSTIAVNALGALRVTKALLPAIARSEGKKILHVSSGMGSIGDNTSGGWYGYRMSKAALNMASRSLAMELKGQGIVSVVINPGWVQTDMGGPSASITVEESAKKIIARVEGLTMADTGTFLDYKGGTWEW
ncbi:MAG: SDR family oxidoreductase [Polyangiales bacterium]